MNRSRILALALSASLVGAVVYAQQPVTVHTPDPDDLNEQINKSVNESMSGVLVLQSAGQLRSKAEQLAKKLTKTEKSEDKEAIKKQLTDILNQQFDAGIQQQQKELERLEKEMNELRALLKKRQDAKSTIVQHRLDQLVQEAEGLGWNSSSGHSFMHWQGFNGIPTPPAPPAPPALPSPRAP